MLFLNRAAAPDVPGLVPPRRRSGGEKEIQRTMLELLNQLDGFDDKNDVKVIMATNKVPAENNDPSMIVFSTPLVIVFRISLNFFKKQF